MRRLLFAVALILLAVGAWAHWPTAPLPTAAHADRVVVSKSDRTMSLYRGATLLKSYSVALGFEPGGHKEREGDGRTPEGHYRLDYRKADSSHYRSLHISYPSRADRQRAAAQGVPPGGFVMIHGMRPNMAWIGRLHLLQDWTNGCIAVTNREMDEIWRAVADGTPIEIRP
jgi:murein L,D-transpeptidase YafK